MVLGHAHKSAPRDARPRQRTPHPTPKASCWAPRLADSSYTTSSATSRSTRVLQLPLHALDRRLATPMDRRAKDVGIGEGSSGMRFDTLETAPSAEG